MWILFYNLKRIICLLLPFQDDTDFTISLFLSLKGTKLKYLYDQDNTDFTKTALFAFEYCQQNSIEVKLLFL